MRRRALFLLLTGVAVAGATVASGSFVVGCVVLGAAIEIGVICAAFRSPVVLDVREDDEDEGGGGGGLPDAPPEPWPPMSPDAMSASLVERGVVAVSDPGRAQA